MSEIHNTVNDIIQDNEKAQTPPKLRFIFRNLYVRILNLFYSLIVFSYISVLTQTNVIVISINSTLLVVIILDNLYAIFYRQGKEYKWFSISVFSFSAMFLVYVWTSILQSNGKARKHFNELELYLYVQIIMIFLIILRCFSTFKRLSQQERTHSALLLLTSSTDCADLLNYVTLDGLQIKTNDMVISIILFIFSLSIIQFSFDLKSLKKTIETVDKWNSLSQIDKFINIFFGTEIWSITLVMLTQDLPFFLIRVLLVFNYRLYSDMNFLIYIVKNFTLITFDIYRIQLIARNYSNERTI